MYLQPSVAPPYTVGARIARPLIPDVITILRAGARRVIGATAKPLYPIDGKAGGLDRRNPQTSLLEGGGPPQRWKEFTQRWKEFAGERLNQTPHHMPDMRRVRRAYDFFCFRKIPGETDGVGGANRPSGGTTARKAVFRHERPVRAHPQTDRLWYNRGARVTRKNG